MAFSGKPTDLEKELVGRDYEEEFLRTHDWFNQDLSGILDATELTRKRNTMFTKMDAKDLQVNSIIMLGNMTKVFTAHDTFHGDGQNVEVHTLGLFVFGGQIDSAGNCVLKFLMPLLKRTNRGAAAATPAQLAEEGFYHPDTVQTPLKLVLAITPAKLYELTSDPALRQRYEEAVVGLKSYTSAAFSPGHREAKRSRTEESHEGGRKGDPKVLFICEFYDFKNDCPVQSNASKAATSISMEETSYFLRLGGKNTWAILPDRQQNFAVFLRKLTVASLMQSDPTPVMTLIADTAGGAGAAKDTPPSLYLQSRRLPHMMNQFPALFAVTPGMSYPRIFVDGIMKGQFGTAGLLNDFGNVKKSELSIQAQFGEKSSLDTLLESHGDAWFLAFGGPWKDMWLNQRTALRSGDWSGPRLKAAYLLHKLNQAMVVWTDLMRTCMHNAVQGYDLRLVSEVYRHFVDHMDMTMKMAAPDDQLIFVELVTAGMHPDDTMFGKRQPPVVTPEGKEQTRNKRKDEESDATPKGKGKKPRAKVEHEDDQTGNRTGGKKSDVCDWHLLSLLGVRNRETYAIEEKRGKVIECKQGADCKKSHPDAITKAAALNILMKCGSQSFLARFKKQALEAAEKLV